MTLTLRPDRAFIPAYRDHQDWTVFEDGKEVNRIYEDRATALLLRFLYWIYERRLLDQLKRRPMPRHIGIILDGNRRHARMRGLSDPSEIYRCGADKLDDILDWCAELRIHAVTLWVFSTENLKRSRAEVSGILSAIEAKVAALAHDPFMHQNRVRVQAIGRLDLLPESVLAAIRAAETATSPFYAPAMARPIVTTAPTSMQIATNWRMGVRISEHCLAGISRVYSGPGYRAFGLRRLGRTEPPQLERTVSAFR